MDGEEGFKKIVDNEEKGTGAREDGAAGELSPEGKGISAEKKAEGNPVTRLYDKIPLSYRQVDILVKVLIAAFVLFLFFLVLRSPRFGGAG
jgi:hypothetical protein